MINGYSAENWGKLVSTSYGFRGGAVSKVEALYYANVTFVANEYYTGICEQ
jgi:hypothetical protein